MIDNDEKTTPATGNNDMTSPADTELLSDEEVDKMDEQVTDNAVKPRPGYVYILPNLVTSASLLAGFWSLILTSQQRFEAAAFAILIGALMDGMDGKVARLTHTSSEFGIQYDSLADLVSFGVAPGFLAWSWHLHEIGRFGACVSFLFVACAALRLARFNVSTTAVPKKFFIGIPSPAAGCLVAMFVLFCFENDYATDPGVAKALLVLTLCSGLLMVSRIRYFSFKEYSFLKQHPFRWLVIVVALISIIMASPFNFCFLLMLAYAVSGIVYSYFLSKKDKKKIFML